MLVVDASTVVAALVDSGPAGRWAEQQLASGDLAAPHLMPVEAANVLRRAELNGSISADVTGLAHVDLRDLPVDLYDYAPMSGRVWELRSNLTTYDACYVALAELLGEPLATLDLRLTRAPGIRCEVRVPPGHQTR